MNDSSVTNSNHLVQEKEHTRHSETIRKLAEELEVPIEEVKRSYDEILESFKSATIKDYVPIFVSRCVRERLKHFHVTH